MDGAASRRQRRAPVVAALLMLLMVALSAQACWSPRWGTAPAEPPASGVGHNTVAAAGLGEHRNITAIVEVVLADRAFVIGDPQLPHGLLVLAPTAGDVSPADVVAVYGTVRQFSFDEFGAPFELADRTPYRPYEGLKVLVASEVRPLA